MGGSVAEWLACWTQAQKVRVQIATLRQTVHTRCAAVHQAAKLVAALLRVAGTRQAWRKVMAAYRRVYDSRHLEADYQEPGSAPELGNRVLATFTFFYLQDGGKNQLA